MAQILGRLNISVRLLAYLIVYKYVLLVTNCFLIWNRNEKNDRGNDQIQISFIVPLECLYCINQHKADIQTHIDISLKNK